MLQKVNQVWPRCQNRSCRSQQNWWSRLAKRGGIRLQGQWQCGWECFETGIGEMFAKMLSGTFRRGRKNHRVPLGLVLFSRGDITHESLKAALEAKQKSGRGRIGEWLRQMGAVREDHLTAALGLQWSCPVFPLQDNRRYLDHAHMIPLPLLQASRMLPVHYLPASNLLYVAFSDGIDYTVLYAVEQMLGCRTQPCLVEESAWNRALEEIRQEPRLMEILFEGVQDSREMVRTAQSYAAALEAEDVWVVACGEYIWVRFQSSRQLGTLLFRLCPPNSPPSEEKSS